MAENISDRPNKAFLLHAVVQVHDRTRGIIPFLQIDPQGRSITADNLWVISRDSLP